MVSGSNTSPNASNATPQQQVPSAVAAGLEANALINQAAKAGVPVDDFDDTDATLQSSSSQKMGSVFKNEEKPIERELPPPPPPPPVPTIVIEDTADDGSGKKEHLAGALEEPIDSPMTPKPPNTASTIGPLPTSRFPEDGGAGEDRVPGALPGKPLPEIPEWFKVGWRQVSAVDDPRLATPEAKERILLDLFLKEQSYGEWYHNAGIIVFAVLASHFLTRFHLGWGWLFVVLAICSTYYSTSMQRFRRNTRDDIQRELVKTRLASEHETVEWLNNFLDRFWIMYEPVLSETIRNTAHQILSFSTPAFLDSLSLPIFTLGNKAPRVDRVRTFTKTEDDIVIMDWGVCFTPSDTSDMTEKQIQNKVKPKISLAIRVGKGLATAALPVLVEDISFTGLLRIRMKLVSNYPHIQTVDITFVEKPVIDFVLKPLGGETFGFDVANLPGLSTFIRDMTHATLGPMMYDPNIYTLNLEQMLSGKPLDAAIGVVEVVIRAARGVSGNGGIDPYVTLSINDRIELARTRYKTNTTNPTWNETKYILVNNLNENLIFSLYDYNEHRKNTKLAFATYELHNLVEDATQDDVVSALLKEGKNRGELRYDVHYYPVVEQEAGKEINLESTVGIVRLVLHQAKGLDQTKSLSGDLNPFAKVHLNHSSTCSFQTPIVKHNNSPVWESSYEFLCADKDNTVITVKVVDDRDFLKDPVVGYMSIKLVDLMEEKKLENRDWFPLSGCKQGKLRISAEWKSLAMAGALHGSDQYKPPIGVVRLMLDRATDIKNVEALLGGKSDPYVRVQVENETKGRTQVVNNNLNPVWDEIVYIPVHSLRETMMLECMDYQHLTKDRPLGSTELAVSDLASPSPEDTRYPYKANGVKTLRSPLRQEQGNVFKGTLHYGAEFIPNLALKNLKFTSDDSEMKNLSKNNDDDGGIVTDDGASEDDDVPAKITIKGKRKHKISLKQKEVAGSQESVATTNTTDSTKDSITSESDASPSLKRNDDKGVEMSIEELLAQQSGVIVCHVISGQLQKKARLEFLLDDGYWPCFSTIKARSTHAQWGYVGEGFVREIDFGRVWLRLDESDDPEKDDIIGEWKGDVKPFLQNTLNGPRSYELRDRDGRVSATITIESRYVPVPVKLEPRETVNNQGILRVELVDGRDIRGADRSGKSDPYAVFTLNDHKVFKSQTKKKTVTPEWNESFETSIPSRVVADFSVELFDWNQIEQAKSLGVGKIDVLSIEPFQASEQIVKLSSTKHGEKGEIRLRLVFQPEIIAKSRKATSTFTTAGRAMTTIGGLPVSAGKGVLHGVTGAFKHKENNHNDVFGAAPPSPTSPLVPTSITEAARVSTASFPSSENIATSTTDPGTLRITVLDAKDISQTDIKPYVTVRVGDKEVKTKHTPKTLSPEWNESFVFAASRSTSKLFVWVHDHKTIGKDKDLGGGEVEIWRHLKPQGVSSADVIVGLKQGNGLVRLRLEFDSSTHPNGSHPSLNNGESAMRRSASIPTPSRFNLRDLRGLRSSTDHDES